MTTPPRIEHDIPIPLGRYNTWRKFFEQMKVGDSFVVKTESEIATVRSAIHGTKFKVIMRRQPDKTQRVWRVK